MPRVAAVLAALVCAFTLLAVPASTADGPTLLRGTITFTQAPSSYTICLYRLNERGTATGQPVCRYFTTPDYAMYVGSGRYIVSFEPLERYARQFHGLQPGDRMLDSAPPVTVTEGDVVDVDFRAEAYPVVTGRVTGPDGGPVPDGMVRAIVETGGPEEDEFWNDGVAVKDSTYRIEVGTPGRYVVRFFDETSYLAYHQPQRENTYATQYWAGSWSTAGARRLDLRWGQTVTDVDVQLGAGGQLRGRLLDPRGRTAEVVGMGLQRRTTTGWQPYRIDAGSGAGAYRTRGVPPGTYRYRLYGFGVYEDGYTRPVVVAAHGVVVTQDVALTLESPPQVRVDRRPRLVGQARTGRPIRVVAGTYSPRRTTTTYRWYADGRRLRSRGPRLVVAPRLRGARIKVEVSARVPGFRSRTVVLHRRVAR